MRIAAVQHVPVWGDREATLAQLEPVVATAAEDGAGLVLLPELFATGYLPDGGGMAEPEHGPTATWMASVAAARRVWVGGSVAEVAPSGPDRRPANVFVLCGPDGTEHRYAKTHPFTYAGEDEVFRAGTNPLTVTVGDLRITLFVCYDLRFADWFWAAAPHTDCYLVPANWPAPRHDHWRALLVARAIENQAWVVGANRVGHGGGFEYGGGTCIVDPWGTVAADAPGPWASTVTAEVDPGRVQEVRTAFPFLADRIPLPGDGAFSTR